MPRFALLEHDYPTVHWDFFLEAGTVLRSWRLAQRPQPHCDILAESAPDHRLMYLDYEGPVSGGRGSVVAIDRGTFFQLQDTPDLIEVRVQGSILQGTVQLISCDNQWRFIWHR